MKRIIKIPLVIISIVLGGFFILLAIAYLQFPVTNAIKNHQAIKYHNACIEQAISTATEIEIKSVDPVGSEGEFIREVQITDHDKIKWLLERFKLPVRVKTSYPFYHNCGGNIKLTIRYDTKDEHHMGYDHGYIMMPISSTNIIYGETTIQDYHWFDYGPGSMGFKKGVPAELNQFLKELGFSDSEIGIEN